MEGKKNDTTHNLTGTIELVQRDPDIKPDRQVLQQL